MSEKIKQYESLNDAFPPAKNPDDAEIWYQTIFDDSYVVDPGNLEKTHTLLGKTGERDLNILYRQLQGPIWSPRGEAINLIYSKGLTHTSMSAGDIIRVGGRVWLVDAVGFKELTKPTEIVPFFGIAKAI